MNISKEFIVTDSLLKDVMSKRQSSRLPMTHEEILLLADSKDPVPDNLESGVKEFIEIIRNYNNSTKDKSSSTIHHIFTVAKTAVNNVLSTFQMEQMAFASVRNQDDNYYGREGITSDGTHIRVVKGLDNNWNISIDWEKNLPETAKIFRNNILSEVLSPEAGKTIEMNFVDGEKFKMVFLRNESSVETINVHG
ncbi:MAG: hypothetical protein JXR95_11695 [Deltaproteobacteria bacterium]|nr:hypothetical protein [Deltaproteobacteria bacterium]